ncbi:hypothetical protein CBS147326_2832 [Penicillium roqueforti]|nr:hypothetical protein CBS147326_2832 [Penicillium roqueforti]
MQLTDDIIRAAALLSRHLHELNARDLLHHRQELQLAFDNLGRALGLSPHKDSISGLSNRSHPEAPPHPISCHNRQDHPAVENVSASASSKQPELSVSAQQPELQASPQQLELQTPPPQPELQTPPHQAEFSVSAQQPELQASPQQPELQTPHQPEFSVSAQQPELQASPQQPGLSAILGREPDSQNITPLPVKMPANEVLLFMSKLERQQKAIETFVKLNEDDAISINQGWMHEDPLDIDIELSDRHISPPQKLRGLLARYIRAGDYLIWAEARYGRPCKEFLIFDQKEADNKRQGHVSEYLSVNNFDPSRVEKIRKSIKHGLKYHSFEYTYGSSGAFAFLSQVHCAFRDLPYGHLSSLAEAIKKSKIWSQLAINKADWISNCRSIYSEECVKYRERGRKRSPEPADPAQQRPSKRVQPTTTSNTATGMETDNATAADGDPEPDVSGRSRNLPIHAELNLPHFPDDALNADMAYLNTQNWQRDTPLLRDFDPLQDHYLFKDFDPIQDWDDLQEPGFYIDTEEILRNSENIRIPCDHTTETARDHLGQEGDSYANLRTEHETVFSTFANTSLPLSVS